MRDNLEQGLTIGQRGHVCARIMSAIEMCFPHSLSGSDFETTGTIQEWLDSAMTASSRLDFARVCQKALASLKNAHTSFHDDDVMASPAFGFHARPLQDAVWTVTQSWRQDIAVGYQIVAIDDRPMDVIFDNIAPFISASRHANAKAIAFHNRWLLPSEGTLTLGNGQTMAISLAETNLVSDDASPPMFRKVDAGIGVLRIPDFGPQNSDDALAQREEIEGCDALVVDLRGNGGGNTPMQLISALHPGQIPLWQEASILVSGLERAHRKQGTGGWPQPGRMVWPTAFAQGDDDAFSGEMVILQDANTCSAAEDFVMPFKTTGRAHIVGERSAGSTGQPYFERLTDEIWFRVAAKQVIWPDGTLFEGTGIEPDTEVIPSADDLVAGRDPALKAAMERLGAVV